MLREEVTDADVATVVSRWTGVPVAKLVASEKQKLLQLESELHERVIGQEEAVTCVAEAVQRSRADLADPNGPVASFMFLGPTGVGKTELAKALASYLFNSDHALVRLDMSEYMEKHSVARLIGAPPGYIGYDEGGMLTDAVRQKPYSVVLFDEIEKAHVDVFNVLLQLLDEGHVTDTQGRNVSFRNCLIIMTSNLGSDEMNYQNKRRGRGSVKDAVMQHVRSHFRPEFINRIDEFICFESLNHSQIEEIVQLQLNNLSKRVDGQRMAIEYDKSAVEYLAREGYDPQYGARPVKRAIQKELLQNLSTEILKGKFNEDDTILIETPRRTMLKLRASVPALRKTMDKEAVVRKIQTYIASSLDIDAINKLAASTSIENFRKGQTLFNEGDEGDALYLISKGSVMVSKRIGGKEVTLAYVAAGNYVGEMALMSDLNRTATIKAAVDCETIKIDGTVFQEVVSENPSLQKEIEEKYGERIVETEKMVEQPEAGSIVEFLMGEGIGEATDVLLIDESICVGCNNCEKACAETHNGISRLDREAGPTFANVHVPTSCRHCEHPHCMTDCPPDAIKRNPEGEVYITNDCIGCGNCQRNCPYGVIQMAPEPPKKPGLFSWLLFGKGPGPGEDYSYRERAPKDARKTAVKCDMCIDITGGASCVRACPTGAAIRVKPNEFMDFIREGGD